MRATKLHSLCPQRPGCAGQTGMDTAQTWIVCGKPEGWRTQWGRGGEGRGRGRKGSGKLGGSGSEPGQGEAAVGHLGWGSTHTHLP